ncbi:hypothetical protein Tco_1454608, partial [Tanacetum coccineum]
TDPNSLKEAAADPNTPIAKVQSLQRIATPPKMKLLLNQSLAKSTALWSELNEHYSQLDGHIIYQDELDALEAPYDCVYPCDCTNGRNNGERYQRKRLIQFLIGLDKSYINTHTLQSKCRHENGSDFVSPPDGGDGGDGGDQFVIYDLDKPHVPSCSKQFDHVNDEVYYLHGGFTLDLLNSLFSKGLYTVKSILPSVVWGFRVS